MYKPELLMEPGMMRQDGSFFRSQPKFLFGFTQCGRCHGVGVTVLSNGGGKANRLQANHDPESN